MILNSIMSTISLTQLLSTCMDASYKGCEVIREFQRRNNDKTIKGTLKEGNEIRSVVTQADIDAQNKIIKGLRNTWGDNDILRIIGEEEQDDDGNKQQPQDELSLLRKDLLNNKDIEDEQLNLKDITIFIDPLDGTREFVEGRLENVACLIGISKNNRAIAGVIGLPFPNGKCESNDYHEDIVIHYSIGDKSFNGVWPMKKSEVENDNEMEAMTTIYTGDSNNPILINATNCAISLSKDDDTNNDRNTKHDIVGGTAAKLLRVATTTSKKHDSIAVLHFKTELWDTCSAESLLTSQGGKITDLFGSKLVYSHTRPFGNVFGVVASSPGISHLHDKLCERMRNDNEAVHTIFKDWLGDENDVLPSLSSPQAIDLARDLDGIPLSKSYIQSLFSSNDNDNILKGYSIPESEAWRGMMSTGGRLNLNWKQPSSSNNQSLPSSVFYKRIVMADLTHAKNKLLTAPHKLTRDVKSYQVETSFLTSKACKQLIKETNIHINRVYGSDLRPVISDSPTELLESKFSLILENFDQTKWKHQWLLDLEGTKAALDAFAKIHAYFWNGSDFWSLDGGVLGEELIRDVWPNGGYMSPALQVCMIVFYYIYKKDYTTRIEKLTLFYKQIYTYTCTGIRSIKTSK